MREPFAIWAYYIDSGLTIFTAQTDDRWGAEDAALFDLIRLDAIANGKRRIIIQKVPKD